MGSIQKQAIQNTIISYLGVAIGFVNTLILQPKMLSPEELGLTRILYSTSVLIATLFPLGLNAFTIKFFPKFRNSEIPILSEFSVIMEKWLPYCPVRVRRPVRRAVDTHW